MQSCIYKNNMNCRSVRTPLLYCARQAVLLLSFTCDKYKFKTI